MARATKNRKTQAALALLILTVVIVAGAVASRSKPAAPVATMPPMHMSSSSTTSSSSSTQTGSTYKDGTYSATGTYDSPGGEESVKVSLMLMSDKVTEASVQSGANDPTAASYQSSFISGYKSKVIGKNIADIKLSNVSGSSLTSQGFNDALQQIEQQAKA